MNAALAAHRRLTERAALPVRTHICRDDPEPRSLGRAVILNGKRYPSVNRARISLGCGHWRIYAMLETGEARYAED